MNMRNEEEKEVNKNAEKEEEKQRKKKTKKQGRRKVLCDPSPAQESRQSFGQALLPLIFLTARMPWITVKLLLAS